MKSVRTHPPIKVEATASAKRRSAQRVFRQSLQTTLSFYLFVGPLLIGLALFFYIPIVWSAILSFSSARATLTPTAFVGLRNYTQMLTDPEFIQSLVTFTIFAVFIVPTTVLFSLGLALLVNSVRFAQGFFRSVFFLPTACSYVLASIIWKMTIFNGTFYGLANSIRHVFGLSALVWIATSPLFWIVLVTVRLWLQLGIYMIIFIAGLQDIPRELYEAALVDGAKYGWQTFRYITFPLLRNASLAVLLLNVIAAFQAFDEFWNIMTGGNQILARPPLVYIFNLAFSTQDYGLGSAASLILTLIIVIFTVLQGRFLGFGRAN